MVNYIKKTGFVGVNPTGTCKMGTENDETAVVNEHF